MLFWIIAGAVALLIVVWMLTPLLRPKNATVTRSAYDVQIYKDQLKEVDSDLARGTLSPNEATASRTEISRRLLTAADTEAKEHLAGNAPKSLSRGLAIVLIAGTLGGGAWLYSDIGVPGLRDMPLQQRLSERPTQAEVEKVAQQKRAKDNALNGVQQPDPKQVALVEKLKEVLKDRPDDIVGHRMLADNLAHLGKYVEARKAQDAVMHILGDKATSDDHAATAEIMIVAAGYYVSPDAEAELTQALQLDGKNPRARYYAGIAFMQRGEPEKTYQIWNALMQEGPADAPWVKLIVSQIDSVAAEAGITRPSATNPNAPTDTTTDATGRGPTNADIEAAGEMSATDRSALINSMVAQLSERLTSDGGTPQEWAKLVKAYAVLGDSDKAASAWQTAKMALANDAAGLAIVRQAAQSAGVPVE